MTSIETGKAFVVKKLSSSTTHCVLVVDKKLLTANFMPPQNVPEMGAIISVEYKYAENFMSETLVQGALANTVDVIEWRPYNGYNSMMFRLSSKPTDEVLKFTGTFYTCGCVRYKGEPLTNPAIFNDVIGIVEDTRNVLDRKYIGKLLATVMYSESASECKWELCYVDEYFEKKNKKFHRLPYHGIIGAISRGPTKTSYITSRDFPHDVRFYVERNMTYTYTHGLLGREVNFYARKGVDSPSVCFYALGDIEPESRNPAVCIYSTFNEFFSLTLNVEYIGCTDENGMIIVWSDKWEFVADSHGVFKNRDYGIYCVEIIRQYVHKQFPRWKIKRIMHFVEKYRSTKNNGYVLRSVERPRISLSIESGIESIGDHDDRERTDDFDTDLEEMEADTSFLGTNSSYDECGAPSPNAATREEPLRYHTLEQAHHRDGNEKMEHELHCYMHECLKSVKVRAAMKQADAELFDALVRTIMRV